MWVVRFGITSSPRTSSRIPESPGSLEKRPDTKRTSPITRQLGNQTTTLGVRHDCCRGLSDGPSYHTEPDRARTTSCRNALMRMVCRVCMHISTHVVDPLPPASLAGVKRLALPSGSLVLPCPVLSCWALSCPVLSFPPCPAHPPQRVPEPSSGCAATIMLTTPRGILRQIDYGIRDTE